MPADRIELPADLNTIGNGAAAEKFKAELSAVIANILDPNTEAEDKRKIVLTFEFIPDKNREMVATLITSRSVFAATKATSDVLWTATKEGEAIATVTHAAPPGEDPRQHVIPLRKGGSGGNDAK